MVVATIFTKIIRGEIPCHKIMENDDYLAFLDIRPINPGHTLVIPKIEIDYIFDLDDQILSGLLTFSKSVAIKIKKVVECHRIGIMVAGLEVPHAHVHLIPITDIGDLNFANAKPVAQDELARMAGLIKSA
jgi:histidine triad (HIT) family protein